MEKNRWEDAFFGEDDFPEQMRTTVDPWLDSHVITGKTVSLDGTQLNYCYVLNPVRGKSVTIVHGFGEFFGKYREIMYLLYQAGYSVFFTELRGHGLSEHAVADKNLIHVDSYEEYLADVFAFQNQIVIPHSKGDVHILFAHSMGGCIATLFLERYPRFFDKAVLSSPMLELPFEHQDAWKLDMFAMVAGTFLLRKHPAPGAKAFDPIPHPETSGSLSHTRFEYQFNLRLKNTAYQTWSGTMGWVRASRTAMQKARENAGEITVPVLILQAECDHLVLPSGQKTVARRAPKAFITTINDSRHEIFNSLEEARHTYWTTVFTFLEKPMETSE